MTGIRSFLRKWHTIVITPNDIAFIPDIAFVDVILKYWTYFLTTACNYAITHNSLVLPIIPNNSPIISIYTTCNSWLLHVILI